MKVNDAINALVDLLQAAAMKRIEQQSQVKPAPFTPVNGPVGNITPKPKPEKKPKKESK
jgi:hypothetical protein